MSQLPVIDFSKLTSPDAGGEDEKGRLLRALQSVGFVYLKNHGITDTEKQQLFAHAARFFALPVAEKSKIETGEAKFFHGWFSPERTSGSTKLSDQKEAFDMGDDTNAKRPNQWPEDWPEFRSDMNAAFDKCHDIHLTLLSALADGVGIPHDYFVPFVQERDHFFRVLHYPETTVDTFKSRMRAGTHTDYGTLTILMNDSNGGLQVRGKDGEFFDVPSIPGCAVINVGDLLSRWFNGELQSTEHRVIEPPADPAAPNYTGTVPARYAIAWFGQANRDAYIEPLEACISASSPKRFEGVFAGKHVTDRLAKLHKDGKNAEVWKEEMYRPAAVQSS
ncbi:hypothetical protein NLG97_g5444 [Lecanicillium saksenae]|uniref:Uncharacterized protein n=1 Tax=Lecanicillium saksenae TaxID=468837 RepID=A0ACC1QV06_9HYPO|nr:hypothetical protein NLG97_g5444 [Lecanicillium saksenae]